MKFTSEELQRQMWSYSQENSVVARMVLYSISNVSFTYLIDDTCHVCFRIIVPITPLGLYSGTEVVNRTYINMPKSIELHDACKLIHNKAYEYAMNHIGKLQSVLRDDNED